MKKNIYDSKKNYKYFSLKIRRGFFSTTLCIDARHYMQYLTDL